MAKSPTSVASSADAIGDDAKANMNKKRSAAKEHEEVIQKFKKAKPSICKAAEELVCPILQGLPIDPVIAEDVSNFCLFTSVLLFYTFTDISQHIFS